MSDRMSARTVAREVFARSVLWTGIATVIRRLAWRDRVAILLYHDPLPHILDTHLTYLRGICDIVPITALYTPSNGRPRAVITLDDGLAGNAALLPVFRKHGVRPTMFICSSIVATRRQHWWLHPGAAMEGAERLKRLSNADRLKHMHQHGFRQDAEHGPSGLTVHDIEAMKPYVDFESHTRFHPILTRCSDEECMKEVQHSREEVEALIGAPCRHFAYPNGNYGEREIAFLKAAGYQTARTCDIGWNDGHTNPYRLKAFDIADGSSVTWLAAQLTGIPLFLRYLRKGSWGGRKPQF